MSYLLFALQCNVLVCSWSMTKWTIFEEVAEMAVKIVTYLYFKSRPFNLLRMSVRQYDEISTIYIFSTNEITALKFQMDCSSAKLVSWKKWRWSKFCCSVAHTLQRRCNLCCLGFRIKYLCQSKLSAIPIGIHLENIQEFRGHLFTWLSTVVFSIEF